MYIPSRVINLKECSEAGMDNLWPICQISRLLYFFLKLYWNIAILIHLCTIYSCFCDTIANLSAVTDPQSLKYLLSGHRRKLLIPAYEMPEDFSNILMKCF